MSGAPKQIGAYAIERELGRGGMGVVYLAKDPRLDRQVAIKVLPDVVARDPERLARFEREARLLASLKHPNIGGIHGLEEAGGQRFLVLEYLEGETLAARLRQGPMRSSEAIRICAQIAAALEAAHENGVIHRDLKPSNVMLTHDDEVKVFDFGLARGDAAMAESSSDLSASPTMTAGATAVGVILGTAAYMSPEQARGKPVDRRTDIWSFGCVLYECLTGKQLFGGETVSDTIAKILEREPDWNALPVETPDRVRELIRRSLEKRARERLRDIGDARIELEEVSSGKTSSISGISTVAVEKQYKGRLRIAWTVAALAGALAIAEFLGTFVFRAPPPAQDPMTFRIHASQGLTFVSETEATVISPDGRRIVFTAFDSTGTVWLWLRELESIEIRKLEGTRDGIMPFWSPDSREIAFFSDGKLRVLSLAGGQPRVVCDAGTQRGGSWGKDWMVFALARGPLYKVPVSGGAPVAITVVDTAAGDDAHRFPVFLPDGERFMYVALPERRGLLPIYVSHVDGGEPVRLLECAGVPRYADPGYLLYRSGSQYVAQQFDARSLRLLGTPVAIGPAADKSQNLGAPTLSTSRSGRLVHPSAREQIMTMSQIPMDGGPPVELDVEPTVIGDVAASPDVRYLAYTVITSPEESDIWLYDVDRGISTRFTFGPGRSNNARWSPDGESLLFVSDRDGVQNLYIQELASSEPRKLELPFAPFRNPLGWSPDGRYVVFSQPGTETGMDVWIASTGEDGEARPYVNTRFAERWTAVAPDGRWAAFQSAESGTDEVYITTFPVAGRKYRVSSGGGFGPDWSPDGKYLYYGVPPNKFVRVAVQYEPSIRTGPPVEVMRLLDNMVGGAKCPNDECVIAILTTTTDPENTLTVVDGWQSRVEGK